jgi:TusE/DsrC/DsvC family sulfur relay protein
MSTLTYAGKAVEVDADGFLQDPEQWTEQIAEEIAREHGIAALTDRHWQVVKLIRTTYLQTGSAPSTPTFSRVSGVPITELHQLFPGGRAKLAAIPKPPGCS